MFCWFIFCALTPFVISKIKLKIHACTTFRHEFLRFWDHRRLVYCRTGPCGFPIGSHMGHRPMSHVRALKGSVWVLTAPYDSALKTIVHGSCGLRTGSRAWGHPYVQFCGNRMVPCGLGNNRTISDAGPYGARWGPRAHARVYLPRQTQLCEIWHVRARKTTNWPSMGTNSLVAHVWKLYMLNLQPRDIRSPHNSKLFETSCGLGIHAVWFPTGSHRFGPYGGRRLSESFLWHRHKIFNA